MEIFKELNLQIKPRTKFFRLTAIAGALLAPSLTHAALIDAGNGLINDTDRNITWTKDGFLFKTQLDSYNTGPTAFVNTIINAVGGVIADGSGVGGSSHLLTADDFDTTTGGLTWWGSMAFVGYLNTINYAGYNDWRLPTTLVPDATCSVAPGNAFGENCTGSELGHLYFEELGGEAPKLLSEQHNENYDLFQNLQDNTYWSSTFPANSANSAWFFFTDDGFQARLTKTLTSYTAPPFTAWAVRDGQATVVPIPTAVWLFGSGLATLTLRRTRGKPSAV